MSPNQMAMLVHAAVRSARVLFPEWSAEKSDREIVEEIAAAAQGAGKGVTQ